MDEVSQTVDVGSNKTVGAEGSKSIIVKTSEYEKTHSTEILSCCANGTNLPPLFIFKRKTLPKNKIPYGTFVDVPSKR